MERVKLTADGGIKVELAFRFWRERAIVIYKGRFVMADLVGTPGPEGVELFEISNTPASADEYQVLRRFVAP